MSSALLVIAFLVSLVNLFGPGALAAWGLSGGDGEPRNAGAGLLALLVVVGLLATPAAAIRALTHDVPTWWWVSLVPAGAWVAGSFLVVRPTWRELALYVAPVAVALTLPGVAIAAA